MMRGDLREPGGLAGVVEASPAGVSVRSRVHEYGGGEYDVWRDRLFFVDDADGRVYGGRVAGASAPLTPPGSRYADLVCSPDGCWLLAVEERPQGPTEPENRLVAIALRPGQGAAGVEAGDEPRVVAAGHERSVPMTYGLTALSSVLGSVLAMTAIIELGFNTVIAVGTILYVLAAGIAWVARPH